MIIGVSLGSFKGVELDEAFIRYLNLKNFLNLNAVELRFEKENECPSLWPWEVNFKIADFLTNFEIKSVHLPFVYLNLIASNPGIKKESINQVKAGIEKASELNVNYCVMHARGFISNYTYEQQIQEWELVLGELAEYAQNKSILLTVENADFLTNLSDLVKIIRKINSRWLKITLDIGHAHIRKIPPLSSYPVKDLLLKGLDVFLPVLIKKNMPYEKYGSIENFIESEIDIISSLHIHDYNGRKDHLIIGNGKIDFSFLSKIEKEFKGPFIFESRFENDSDFIKNYRNFKELINS
ncbi:MAG: sugar phosphate isomerase/epimerase family protein [Candidatus Methanoperedens sp.]